MEVLLNSTQISDLFFNIEKPLLSEAYGLEDEKGNPDTWAISESLKAEAESFSQLVGGQVSAEWLINDFNGRI
jgi:hypothetical protein